MRISICKDSGEVFAIHELPIEKCDKAFSELTRRGFYTTPLESVFQFEAVIEDIKTALRNEATGEWIDDDES